MKANAPEKIYVVDTTFPDYVDFEGSPINTKRIDDHDIEYTRTDAFINKTCEWLMENVEKHISADGEYTVYYKEMFEDFRKYMKGE